LSFVRTVVSRFSKVIWSKRFFNRAFEFRDVDGLLLGLVSRWGRSRGWCSRILRGDLCIRYSGLSVDGLLDEGGRSILFDLERGVGLLLQVLVVGVIAITENTAYCTRPVLAVAIEGQMITGAFDTTRV
jgi:hypothetical protein